VCLRNQAKCGRNISFGVGDDGIATSSGSRPCLQWWIATPFESLVPSFVPKSVVTVGSFMCWLIPIRRVPVLFTTRPLFGAERKECEVDETKPN
jgi:hypothetical protein